MTNPSEIDFSKSADENPDVAGAVSGLGSDNQIAALNEEDSDIEAMRRLIGEFIRGASKVNEGNNGVIFKNILEFTKEDPGGKVERKEYAAKMLKIGSFEDLQRERKNQQQAYEILQVALQEVEHPEDYALIPKVDFCELIEVDAELAERLKEQGVFIDDGKVGVMMMDWVNGEDLATHLFKEVLSRENARRQQSGENKIYLGENPLFNQLHATVSQVLDFRRPGGKGTTPAERLVEKEKVEDLNEQSVYRYLKKSGFRLSPQIVLQIENTIKLLRDKGFTLWDNHMRNAMINAESGQAFLIDFAPFDRLRTEGYRQPDPFDMTRKLRQLTTSPEEDRQAEAQAELSAFERGYERISQNERWLKKFITPFKQPEQFFDHLDYATNNSMDQTELSFVIYALLYQIKANFITREAAEEFYDSLIEKNKNSPPWKINALNAGKQQMKKAEI